MQYYPAISRGYNQLHAQEQLAKAALIKEHAELHGLLLDIGAGTGIPTRLFSDRALCIALDPCKEMLLQCNGLRVVARAEQLPFKSNCFDSIVSVTALHHADLAKAKQEIERVAKRSAAIAIAFFKRASSFKKAKRFFKRFKRIESEKDLIFIRW